MPWGVVAAAVVGAYSANQQGKAAKKGADAQAAGQQASIDEQRREYDQSRQDQMPWLTAGSGALAQMGALNGGDFSSFKASPDYQFTLDQGLKLADRGAASHGALGSGGHSADLMQLGQGLASQQYNTFYNRLQSMAGQGQTTASGLGTLGANMASNIGNAYTNMGNARASSYGQVADANSQFAAGLGGAFNNWYQGNKANNGGGTGWYLGNNPGKG
jgi:hypothetical protein